MNDAEIEAHFEHNVDVAWKHFLNKEPAFRLAGDPQSLMLVRKMFGEGFLYGWLCGTDNLDKLQCQGVDGT